MRKTQNKLFKNVLLGLFLCIGLFTKATAQDFQWVKSMEGWGGGDAGAAVAVDAAGNLYVTGYFNGTVDFDPGPGTAIFSSGGNSGMFIAKYDPSGNYVWANGINVGGNGSNLSQGAGVAMDTAGNVYVTGYFSGAVDFDPGSGADILTAAGYADIFLTKYDNSGNYVWAKGMGGTASNQGRAVALDGAGNAYITGYFSGTVDFDPGSGMATLTTAGGNDIFLAKYDPSGSYVWAKSMGGTIADIGSGIAVDATTGNVYVTGYYTTAANFDTAALTSAGGRDIFLAKYDNSGNYIWAKSMGGNTSDLGSGVAVDGTGNVYITGGYTATADFDPGPDTAAFTTAGTTGAGDVFLAKYDPSGNYIWAKSMGSILADQGSNVAVDKIGNVYLTGIFQGTADFDPGSGIDTITAVRAYDAFLAKYDSSGNYVWAKNLGGSGADYGLGVTTDGAGNVYGSGYFYGTANYDPGSGTPTLTSRGDVDIFILKLGCNDTSSSYLTVSACTQNYTLNRYVYTASGIYTQILANAARCDSTLTLDLTLSQIEKPVININEFTLGVTDTYATYQWIRNGMPVSGATNPTYTVTENGNYQVAVKNENDCADTSAVYTVTNYTGVETLKTLAKQINVYPNPTADMVYIQSPVKVNIMLTDMQARTIREAEGIHGLSLKDLSDGIYLLQISDRNGTLIKMEKVVKQGQ